MSNPHILLVTIDQITSRIWSNALYDRKIITTTAATIADAVTETETNSFDLVLIDTVECNADAIEHCRQLRAQLINPILLLTEETKESLLVKMYQIGVDESITKPIGPQLLLAKINAWLHRSWNMPVAVLDTLSAGAFFLDPSEHILMIDNDRSIKLTNLEFRLLHLLMSNPGRSMDSQLIVDRVWGFTGEGDSSVLKHLVYRLRRKIEPNPGSPIHLQTSLGEGYSFHP